MSTMRFFNAEGDRISTAVTLKDGGVLQVFPTKQVFADVDAWKALNPTWAELRKGNHTLFNADHEAQVESHEEFILRRARYLTKFRTGARPIRSAERWSPKMHPGPRRLWAGPTKEELIAIHLAKSFEEGTHWHKWCEAIQDAVWNIDTLLVEEVYALLNELIHADLRVLKRNEDFRWNLNFLHAHFLALQDNNSSAPRFTIEHCTAFINMIVRMKKVNIK
jgi:hypothetical protein